MSTFVSKQIGSYTYAMRPLAPDKVLEHGYALMAQVIAPGIKDMGMASSASFASFAGLAVGGILARINSDVVKAALTDVMKTAVVVKNEAEVELDKSWKVHFIGKPGELAEFLSWALMEQFRDFFAGTFDQLSAVGAQAIKALVPKKDSDESATG